jgi:hypothetical protein
MSMQPISLDLQQAVIQCCGKCFHYKSDLKAILIRSGVSESVYLKYEQLEKFKIARAVLSDLDQAGENGKRVQHRIVSEFVRMQSLNTKDLPDIEGAKAGLIYLKSLAAKQVIVSAEEEREAAKRAQSASERLAVLGARSTRLRELSAELLALATASDAAQTRGYDLEKMLRGLFELFEIEYRPPYKTGAEQTDGLFVFKSHHYLVEARWRSAQPTLNDLRGFREKIKNKYEGARGLFISMAGFRENVVDEFQHGDNPVLLLDGRDLTEILEERISLPDALDAKLEHAAKTGNPFHKLYGGNR